MSGDATHEGGGGPAPRPAPQHPAEGHRDPSDHEAVGPTDGEHGAHGSVALYVWIGVILAVVTGVEVAIFYIEALDAVEAPLLILLSTAKVVLVIMFFMHLKMDHRSLTWIFMSGVVLATFMVSGLVILYHLIPWLGG